MANTKGEQLLKIIFDAIHTLEHRVSGSNGSKLLNVAAHTGLSAVSLIVQEDTSISAFKVDGVDALAAYGLSGVTLKAGGLITVPDGSVITDITISGGTVIIYNK